MRIILVLAVLLAASPLFSANITVPSLEIYSWARNDGSGFALDSYGDMELQLDGGYKFGGAMKFGFSSSSLETAAYNDSIAFESVSVTLRELFGIPLNFTYFIGQGDTFGTGEVFTPYFGTPLLSSNYTSFLHFPNESSYNFYQGIHTVYGTGGKFEFAPPEKNWLLSLYIYQDSSPAFLTGTIPPPAIDFSSRQGSLDVRTAFNFEKVRLEAFVGATLPTSDSAIGYIRNGLFLHAGSEKFEFMAEFGMPRWRPLDDAFGLDLFYLLVEPRIHLGAMSIVPTFFWRPGYYQQEANATLIEAMDINLDLQFHGKEESLISGGIEGNFVYQTAPTSETTGKAIPYIQLSTPGVVYKAQVNTKVWPFDLSDLSDTFEVFLSIQAAF